MPVSGLVVQIDPNQRESIVNTLHNLENVDLPEVPEGESLIVVLDVSTMHEEEELFKRINEIPGVRNVTLSYHNFEDLNEAKVS